MTDPVSKAIASLLLPSAKNLGHGYGSPHAYRAAMGEPVFGGMSLRDPDVGAMLFERFGDDALEVARQGREPLSYARGLPAIETSMLGRILRENLGRRNRSFGMAEPLLRNPMSILLAQAVQQRLAGVAPTGGITPGVNIADIPGGAATALFGGESSPFSERMNALSQLQGAVGEEQQAFNRNTLRAQTVRPLGEIGHPALRSDFEFRGSGGITPILSSERVESLGFAPRDLPRHLDRTADSMRLLRGLVTPEVRGGGPLGAATPNMQNLLRQVLLAGKVDPASFESMDDATKFASVKRGMESLRTLGAVDFTSADRLAGPDPDAIPGRYLDPQQVTEQGPRPLNIKSGKSRIQDIPEEPDLRATQERGRMQAGDRKGFLGRVTGQRDPVPYGSGGTLEGALDKVDDAGRQGNIPLNAASKAKGTRAKQLAVRDLSAKRIDAVMDRMATDMLESNPDNAEVQSAVEQYRKVAQQVRDGGTQGKARFRAMSQAVGALERAVDSAPNSREYRPLFKEVVNKLGGYESATAGARGEEQIPTATDREAVKRRSEVRKRENKTRRALGTRMSETSPGSGEWEMREFPQPDRKQSKTQRRTVDLLSKMGLSRGTDFARSKVMDTSDPVGAQALIERAKKNDGTVFGKGEVAGLAAALATGKKDLGLVPSGKEGMFKGDPSKVLRALGFTEAEMRSIEVGTADADGRKDSRAFKARLARLEGMADTISKLDSTDVGNLQAMARDYAQGKVTLTQLRQEAENTARKKGLTFDRRITKPTGIGHTGSGEKDPVSDGPVEMRGRLVKGRGAGAGIAYEVKIGDKTHRGTLEEISRVLADNDPVLKREIESAGGFDKVIGRLRSKLQSDYSRKLSRGRRSPRFDADGRPNERNQKDLTPEQSEALGTDRQMRAVKESQRDDFVEKIVSKGREAEGRSVVLTRKQEEAVLRSSRLRERLAAVSAKDRVNIYLSDGSRLPGRKSKPGRGRSLADYGANNRSRFRVDDDKSMPVKVTRENVHGLIKRMIQESKDDSDTKTPKRKPTGVKRRLKSYRDRARSLVAESRSAVDSGPIETGIARLGNAIRSMKGRPMAGRIR